MALPKSIVGKIKGVMWTSPLWSQRLANLQKLHTTADLSSLGKSNSAKTTVQIGGGGHLDLATLAETVLDLLLPRTRSVSGAK